MRGEEWKNTKRLGGGGMRDAGREGGHECEGRVYG